MTTQRDEERQAFRAAADGKQLSEITLDAPCACDGLAAAKGRIALSLANGELLSFGR